MLLTVLIAQAASTWTAACPARTDESVWFVLTQAADAPPSPEYECGGLFLDGVACPQAIVFGKVKATGTSRGGFEEFELRYLPHADMMGILGFLGQPGGGVKFAPSIQALPGATPPPPTPAELLEAWLVQRARASQPTKNIGLHVWTCPDAPFALPEDAWKPYGMSYTGHVGKAPL